MPDLQKLSSDKEKIISTIRFKGPSFPARISKGVNTPPLFVAALLAELVSEKRLKMSNMKVGSSPIYFLPGQEHQLENFSMQLKNKEREAFDLLKEKEILKDEKQQPAIRVALRSIKDFAIPITVKTGDEIKLYWRYFTIPEERIKEKIQALINLPKAFEKTTPENQLPQSQNQVKAIQNQLSKSRNQVKPIQNQLPKPQNQVSQSQKPLSENQLPQQTKPDQPITKSLSENHPIQKPLLEDQPITKSLSENHPIQKQKEIQPIFSSDNNIQTKKQKTKSPSKFASQIQDYLKTRNIKILEEINSKQKEFISKVRLDTPLGKQSFHLTAKDKKKISEEDLIVALQRSQIEKMPAIFFSPGELDKNAAQFLEHWKNMIKFERVNL